MILHLRREVIFGRIIFWAEHDVEGEELENVTVRAGGRAGSTVGLFTPTVFTEEYFHIVDL
jgi:hypothetical protein